MLVSSLLIGYLLGRRSSILCHVHVSPGLVVVDHRRCGGRRVPPPPRGDSRGGLGPSPGKPPGLALYSRGSRRSASIVVHFVPRILYPWLCNGLCRPKWSNHSETEGWPWMNEWCFPKLFICTNWRVMRKHPCHYVVENVSTFNTTPS